MEHFILPLIIIIFLMLPISVRAVRSKQAIDVDIYLSKLLDIKIDYNTFMRGLLSAGREQVKSSGLFQTIQKTYEYRSLLNDITKRSNVTKVTFVPKYYIDDPIVGTYINILNWNVISIFKKYLHDNFRKVEDEYYYVNIPNESQVGFLFEIEIKTRVIYLIISIIKNIKIVPKIIKSIFKRRSESNERASS
ncbi:MAG: hypothetical protein ACOX40_06240 [Bacilli bacterium]|jgi:hypothetical protein|nr:hypothetical protein [Acholeplasmataceae bacterium]